MASNYLRGRQSVTSCRGVMSKVRIVHNGVPQCTKMSPTLFSLYLADMPRPTEPVKQICYADDITVWASGVKIPELEHKLNDYLTEISCFLDRMNLCISDLRIWMIRNKLMINDPKTEFLIITSSFLKQSFDDLNIMVGDSNIVSSNSARNLGVIFDKCMKL